MIFPELDLFETDFSVMELLGRKGIKLQRHDSGYYLTGCPSCQQPAWVLPTGLFCDAVDCRFTAGGPLEVEVLSKGKSSFYEAAHRMQELFPEKRHFWDMSATVPLLQRLASQAQTRRTLFEFFLRVPLEQQGLADVGLLEEATAHLTGHLQRQMTLFLMGPRMLDRLNVFLMKHGVQTRLVTSHASVIVPLFHRHHALSSLLVWTPKTKRTQEVVITPSRFAFSGLLNSSPGAKCTYVVGDPIQALLRGRQVAMMDAQQHVLGLMVDSDVSSYGILPKMVYHPLEGEGPTFGVALKQANPRMEFALEDIPTEDRATWFDYVREYLGSVLRSTGGSLSDAALLFTQGADLSNEERSNLIHRLRADGFNKAARQLIDRFSTRILMKSRDVTIYETPDGYTSAKDRQAFRETIANFTLHFTRNIVFPDQLAVFHGGTLRFSGESHPIVFSSEDIETAAKCQSAARSALLKTGADMMALPTIHNASLFKQVGAVLRESVANLPPTTGVAALGWHHDRTSFTTPQWQLSMDGVRNGPFDFHPSRMALNFFTSSTPKFGEPPPSIPAGLADLCRLALAGTFRSFAHLQLEGVPLEQTQFAQTAVARVFAAMGQRRPVNGTGLQPEGLGRWPVYGFEHNHAALKSSGNFIFGFCDRGFKLVGMEDVDEVTADAVGHWLNGAIHKLCEHLLSGGSTDFERRRRALFFCELLEEGTILAEQLFGITTERWATAPESFAMTEKLLDSTTPDKLDELFSYSYEAQRIEVFHQRAPGIDGRQLHLELQKIAQDVVLLKDSITVPSPQLHSVLRHYYGTEISFAR